MPSLLLSTPIARILAHVKTECHVERYDGIEARHAGHLMYLEIVIGLETFDRVFDPVIVHKLAEVASGKLAYGS